MNDPWKYVAFPVAAVIGYLASIVLTQQVAEVAGLTEFVSRVLVIGGTGLVAGFMVDELLPAYLEQVRGGSSGSGDMDFDSGGDLDFDS